MNRLPYHQSNRQKRLLPRQTSVVGTASRRGLAPIELVLWLPILLFVTALIVNYGTAAAWRVRAEIVSRDAGERDTTPRTGRNENYALNFPAIRADAFSTDVNEPIQELDDPTIQHEVVRGPLQNGFEVYPTFDPNSRGHVRGTSDISRPYALLQGLGTYTSGDVQTTFLDDSWAISRMYFSNSIPIPNEDLHQSASREDAARLYSGYHRFSTVPNLYRRTKLLYELPTVGSGLSGRFASAIQRIVNMPRREGLRVLDNDQDFIRYRGSAPDFHPRAPIICSLDPEEVRDRSLERNVIDYIGPRGEIRLGGVTRLPRTLSSAFLGLYRGELDRLERLPPTPGIAGEIAILERKIRQLEQYRARLTAIEDRLRSSSTARP